MIKEFLDRAERKKALEFCNKILCNDFTPKYIIDSTSSLIKIVRKLMPENYPYYYLLNDNSILIDDILEMDSITEKEKNEAIKDLILVNMEKFTILATDIFAKIHSDETEAQERSYCNELIKNF